jgi:Tfp pilus assembly protein FimT
MNRGISLVEVMIVVVLAGMVGGFGLRPVLALRDRIKVQASVNDVSAFYRRMRFMALFSGLPVRLEIRGDSAVGYLVAAGGDSVAAVSNSARRRGVRMKATRGTLMLSGSGIGQGAANTSIVFDRGLASDTLVTSRLGRLRRRKNMMQPSTR